MSADLVRFVEARIAEDQDAAERASDHNGRGDFANDNYGCLLVQSSRVLRQCEAFRRIVEDHVRHRGDCDRDYQYGDLPCPTMRALTYHHEAWTPGENVSRHMVNMYDGGADANCAYPTLSCTHGFYAFYDKEYWLSTLRPEKSYTSKATLKISTFDQLRVTNRSTHPYIMVTGVIEAYGHIVRGTKGFRAEKAVIMGLSRPFIRGDYLVTGPLEDQIVRGLEAYYPNLPIFNSTEQMLETYPLYSAGGLSLDGDW